MTRAFLVVMDSVGIGGAPDADQYFNGDLPDTGANTVAHIAQVCARGDADDGRSGPLRLPHLDALGLGRAVELASGVTAPGLEADAPPADGEANEAVDDARVDLRRPGDRGQAVVQPDAIRNPAARQDVLDDGELGCGPCGHAEDGQAEQHYCKPYRAGTARCKCPCCENTCAQVATRRNPCAPIGFVTDECPQRETHERSAIGDCRQP